MVAMKALNRICLAPVPTVTLINAIVHAVFPLELGDNSLFQGRRTIQRGLYLVSPASIAALAACLM